MRDTAQAPLEGGRWERSDGNNREDEQNGHTRFSREASTPSR